MFLVRVNGIEFCFVVVLLFIYFGYIEGLNLVYVRVWLFLILESRVRWYCRFFMLGNCIIRFCLFLRILFLYVYDVNFE